ncbi:MAG: ParB N-terminal domain-containing protein [Ectothiorhodospiraceae bacterium AqS1]|nr:ParB N-terminal domain-containing protein [Ectothiorhodospiraceae bacterium AqS1]
MSDQNYIKILGDEIPYDEVRIEINRLRYYEDNPRVYPKLIQDGPFPKNSEDQQIFIEEKMQKEKSVKKLLKTIKNQGGITEPLIVLQKNYQVIDGNSRLAALRMLSKKHNEDALQFMSAPCRIMTLTNGQIDAYLHLIHIDSKTEWTPYEKAMRAYKRVFKDGVEEKIYSSTTGATIDDINKSIEIIKLMQENESGTLRPDMFSYYEQLVKSRKLNRACNEHPELKPYLLSVIRRDDLEFKAQELRDGIPQIAQKPKQLRKLMKGEIDFIQAVEITRISQPKNHLDKALANFQEIEKDSLVNLDRNELNDIELSWKKCKKQLERLEKIIQGALGQ